MGKLEKYSSYKDSGVEWLGEIPEHWEIKKLKFIVKEHGGNGFPVTEQGKNGSIPFYKVSDMNGSDTFIEMSNNYVSESTVKKMKWNLIPVNSIVTAKIGEALRKNHRKITKISSIIDNNCIAFEPIRIDIKFNFYLHKIIDFDWFSNAGAVPSISVPQYKNFKIALPPKKEQTKIASFLDEKTAQIDEVISQKEKLIELLKERKQIVINDAVTKGLDKNIEFVDSGVEWIGNIPKHWKISKVKNIFKLIIEPAPKANEEELLSIYTDIGVRPRKELAEKGNKASTTDGYWRVKKGDFIVNKLLAWMGAIGLSEYDGVTSPAYDILRAKKDIVGIYYHELFRLKVFSQEMKKHSRGIMDMRLRLYFDKFGDILIPYPSYDEQLQIVEYIENQTSKIDKAIELQQNYISKLKEYKASLIDSVVTGKVRV